MVGAPRIPPKWHLEGYMSSDDYFIICLIRDGVDHCHMIEDEIRELQDILTSFLGIGSIK